MDPFMTCPYNSSHRVPRSRLQAHIVKCQSKYPQLMICPYNATHRYPQDVIEAHCIECPDKAAMFPEPVPKSIESNMGAIITPKPILQAEYLPETDPNHECWDN